MSQSGLAFKEVEECRKASDGMQHWRREDVNGMYESETNL